MVEFVPWGDPTDSGIASVSDNAINAAEFAPTPNQPDAGFWGPAWASFQLNNPLWSAGRELYFLGTGGDLPDTYDRNFNQYTWMKQNLPSSIWDPQNGRLKDEISAGLFDDALTPRQVQVKVNSLLSEKKLIEQENGNFWGSLTGNVAAAATDPVTYTPMGEWWKTGSLAIRMGKAMLHSAAVAGTQESLLWATQDLRTWQQSLMNVGVASVLGGGLAMFGRAHLADHPLNPENPENPLAPANLTRQGVVTQVPGEGSDTIGWAPSTVGAAEAPTEAPSRLGGQSTIGSLITGVTPAGRALQYSSDDARSLITKLIDLGGVYTDTNRFGVRTGPSAEDFKALYENRWGQQLLADGDDLARQTSEALGDLGSPRLNAADFNSTTQKLLTQTFTPADQLELVGAYGDQGAQRVVSGAQEYATKIEQAHSEQASLMKQVGAIRDDGKVDALTAQLKQMRDERNAALAPHDAMAGPLKDAAAQAEKLAPSGDGLQQVGIRRQLRDDLTAHDARRREIAAQFDTAPIERELAYERGLAPDLGPDYGHAQLWEPAAISAAPARFKDFLLRVLANDPDEGWLADAHGLTPGQFKLLPSSDPALYQRVLREWAGDEHDFRLNHLQNALEDARQREKLSKLDYNEALRQAGLLDEKAGQAEVREYGRYRDMLNAKVAAERETKANLVREEQAIVEAATAARQTTRDRFLTEGGIDTNGVPAIRQADKARQVAIGLRESDVRLADLLAKQRGTESAYQNAVGATVARKSAKSALEGAAVDLKTTRDLASQNVGQVRRAVRAAGNRTPLDEAINDIVANLMDRGRLPASAMEGVVPESGRFKARRIVLAPDQKIEAAREGWLRTDLPHILVSEARQISGHLGLRQALDIGRGKTFETWADVERAVTDSYDRLVERSPARSGALRNEQAKALADLRGLKDRLLNQVDPGIDRDSWIMWLQRQMRQYNFIRYGAGMLTSSLPDLGSFALQHRLLPMLWQHGREAMAEALTTRGKATEFKRFLSAAELASHASLLSYRVNDNDLEAFGGIGARGSLKNRVTSTIDRYGAALSDFSAKWSGLPQWDRYWKILSGIMTAHDIRDQVGRYDSLSELERTKLASLGIGEREAGRLNDFLTKFGEEDEHGNFDPHWEKWYQTEDGRNAAFDMRMAVNRDMNRSRFWPGIGDRPLYMDKWWGKLLGQFQGFAYTFVNRYMTPLFQRAVHYQDMRSAASLAALMVGAVLTMTLKDATRGITPAQRWDFSDPKKVAELGAELMDRSMLPGYLSPYADAAVTLSGLTGPTRFQREGLPEKLLGINSSLVGDASRFGSALSGYLHGDTGGDQVVKKLIALSPFSQLLRMGYHLYNDK